MADKIDYGRSYKYALKLIRGDAEVAEFASSDVVKLAEAYVEVIKENRDKNRRIALLEEQFGALKRSNGAEFARRRLGF